MARTAKKIDEQKILALKQKIKDSDYLSLAILAIAHKLADQFFAAIRHP